MSDVVEKFSEVLAGHQMLVDAVFTEDRLYVSQWRSSCGCGWEAFRDTLNAAYKATGVHLAESVEHLIEAEVTEALEAHEEAVRLLSQDQYEYCVEYDPFPNLDPRFLPHDRPHQSQWLREKTARTLYKDADEAGMKPVMYRRIKPGPEERLQNDY